MAQKTALMLLVLYTLLIIGLLVLVVSGAHLYAAALDAKDSHAEQRNALSYVQTQAASCRSGIFVDQQEGWPVLRLVDSGYETCIYLYENSLRTQMIRSGLTMDLSRGDEICSMNKFILTWVTPRLLKVETSQGTAFIRCDGGGTNG